MKPLAWTEAEIKYLQDNSNLSVRQLALDLKRPYETVRSRVKKLKKEGWKTKARPKRLTTADKLATLGERFKNPLLRVAINPSALLVSWTPVDRLHDLELYSGTYNKGG